MDSKRIHEEEQGEQEKCAQSRTQPSPFDGRKLLHYLNSSNTCTFVHSSFGGNTATFHIAHFDLEISILVWSISAAYLKDLLAVAVGK